jgi:Protein of unknown function (DUF4058)
MRFPTYCSVRIRAADASQRRAGFRKIRMGVSSEEVARWTRFPLRVWGADMKCPFPGMDPYLEHPVLWESVHARLMVAIANQLQPKLDPRYVASIEERVFIEGPQRRIPDEWIQKVSDAEGMTALADPESDTALIVEVDDLEIRESRVEILDSYNELKLIALIEVVSPTNKAAGPGRTSYKAKQAETLARDCHLIEIDLLSHGRHVLCIPEWRLKPFEPFDSLCCVSRWPLRNRFELYPRPLRQRLPRLKIPLADEDADATLDLQVAFEQVYVDGRYWRRIRYDEKCMPRLSSPDQIWADERIALFRTTRPDLFPQ